MNRHELGLTKGDENVSVVGTDLQVCPAGNDGRQWTNLKVCPYSGVSDSGLFEGIFE